MVERKVLKKRTACPCHAGGQAPWPRALDCPAPREAAFLFLRNWPRGEGLCSSCLVNSPCESASHFPCSYLSRRKSVVDAPGTSCLEGALGGHGVRALVPWELKAIYCRCWGQNRRPSMAKGTLPWPGLGGGLSACWCVSSWGCLRKNHGAGGSAPHRRVLSRAEAGARNSRGGDPPESSADPSCLSACGCFAPSLCRHRPPPVSVS